MIMNDDAKLHMKISTDLI